MAGASNNPFDGQMYTQKMVQRITRNHFFGNHGAYPILRHGGISNHVYGATDFSGEILQLRTAHARLSDALYLLNKIFSLQLFLSLNLCFCCILLTINYEVFVYYAEQLGWAHYAAAIWVSTCLFRFIAVVTAASYTSNAAKYAGKLVTVMGNRFLSKDTKEELTLFYTHILSHDFEFNAWGLFPLKMRLVMSAIATGTTYLVILLQFEPHGRERWKLGKKEED